MTTARNDRNTVQFGPSRTSESYRLDRLEEEVKTEITNQIVNQIIETGSSINRATVVTYDAIAQVGTATLEGGGSVSFANASRLSATTNDVILVTQTTDGPEWYMVGRITFAGNIAAPEFPNGVLDPSFPIDTWQLTYPIVADSYHSTSSYSADEMLIDYTNTLGFGNDTMLKVRSAPPPGTRTNSTSQRLVALSRGANANAEISSPPNVAYDSSTEWFIGGGKLFVRSPNASSTLVDIYDFATGWDPTGVTTANAMGSTFTDYNYGAVFTMGRASGAGAQPARIHTFTTGTPVDRGALGLPSSTALDTIAFNNGYHIVQPAVTGTDYVYRRSVSSPTNTFTQLTSAGGIAFIGGNMRGSYVTPDGNYVYRLEESTGDVYEYNLTTGLPTVFYTVLPANFKCRAVVEGTGGGLLFFGFQYTNDLVNNYGANAPSWTPISASTTSGSLSFAIWGWNGVSSSLVYYDHDLLNYSASTGEGAGYRGDSTSVAVQECTRPVRLDGNLRLFVGGYWESNPGNSGSTNRSSGWILEFTNL